MPCKKVYIQWFSFKTFVYNKFKYIMYEFVHNNNYDHLLYKFKNL